MKLSTLMSAVGKDGESRITLPDGRNVRLMSIEREDGSGLSFNLTVKPWEKPVEVVYVRCER